MVEHSTIQSNTSRSIQIQRSPAQTRVSPKFLVDTERISDLDLPVDGAPDAGHRRNLEPLTASRPVSGEFNCQVNSCLIVFV